MGISREASIRRYMRIVGMPRAVAEEAVTEIEEYVDDWARQMIDYHRRHRQPNGG